MEGVGEDDRRNETSVLARGCVLFIVWTVLYSMNAIPPMAGTFGGGGIVITKR